MQDPNVYKRQKIFVTGGHLTPALAVIEEIRKEKKNWDVVFVGRMYAMEGDTTPSEEYGVVTGLGLRFLSIPAGRFRREASFATLTELAKVPFAFAAALRYIQTEKPDAVLSFGGYVALPVVLAAAMLGVPVITHEQTRVVGLANRIIARFAKAVCVSFADMVGLFPKGKTELTGLPIRSGIFTPPERSPFSLTGTKPLLYITGGATGAQSVNDVVFSALPALLAKYRIVHQTGKRSYPKALETEARLPEQLRARYAPSPYLTVDGVSWAMHNAALVVGRSGANTVGEVLAIGKRALFIPLPWAAGNEQEKNARLLADAGLAVVLGQESLTPDILVSHIDTEVQRGSDAIRTDGHVLPDAAAKVVAVVERCL